MDVTMLINFVLNQLVNDDVNNTDNNSNPDNYGQIVDRPVENTMKPVIDLNKILEIPTISQEFTELWKRVIDKTYVDSRKYEITPTYKHEGKVAVLTHAEDGIGAEVALHLSKIGYKVILGRKEQVAFNKSMMTKLDKGLKMNNIQVVKLDITSLESVREFAKEVSKMEPQIDLLINSSDQIEEVALTKDGVEKNFQTNYLGHFLLTQLLIPNLKKSENGRVVNISSVLHYFFDIDLDNLDNIKKTSTGAYAQSKLANVLFTRELSRWTAKTNITTYVVSPEILKGLPLLDIPLIGGMFSSFCDPVIGAQTVLYVSLEDSLKNESGFYYNNLTRVHPLPLNGNDVELARKLWTISKELVKMYTE